MTNLGPGFGPRLVAPRYHRLVREVNHASAAADEKKKELEALGYLIP
jgi:hypothetical protein